jgi:hypothetical protein
LGTLLQKQTREPGHEGDEEEIHDRGRALAGGDAGSVVVVTDGMRVVCDFAVFAVWWVGGGVEEVARAEEGKVGGGRRSLVTYLTAGGAGARAGNQATASVTFTVHVSREEWTSHCYSLFFR